MGVWVARKRGASSRRLIKLFGSNLLFHVELCQSNLFISSPLLLFFFGAVGCPTSSLPASPEDGDPGAVCQPRVPTSGVLGCP